MIVNVEREPELSLYYLGSVLLKILKSKKVIPIDVLFQEIQKKDSCGFLILCIGLVVLVVISKN